MRAAGRARPRSRGMSDAAEALLGMVTPGEEGIPEEMLSVPIIQETPEMRAMRAICRPGVHVIRSDIPAWSSHTQQYTVHAPCCHREPCSINISIVACSRCMYPHVFDAGTIVWAKVEGHDWWPARVVRRRAVPREVGPPPGGPVNVRVFLPVVFFTPRGIPGEVVEAMDSEDAAMLACIRALSAKRA